MDAVNQGIGYAADNGGLELRTVIDGSAHGKEHLHKWRLLLKLVIKTGAKQHSVRIHAASNAPIFNLYHFLEH